MDEANQGATGLTLSLPTTENAPQNQRIQEGMMSNGNGKVGPLPLLRVIHLAVNGILEPDPVRIKLIVGHAVPSVRANGRCRFAYRYGMVELEYLHGRIFVWDRLFLAGVHGVAFDAVHSVVAVVGGMMGLVEDAGSGGEFILPLPVVGTELVD